MRIATVTLNPAIDQTVRADHFRPNTVNYAQSMRFDAGGKGVNVAGFLADYGYDVAVTGFLGQENVATFEQFFASKHIDDQFIRIPGSTRIGVKIVDEANQQTTDINMPGFTPPDEAMGELTKRLSQLATSCDWFIFSGRLAAGLPVSTYATLVGQVKELGKKVVLDTSLDALREGIAANPTIIKPNIDELRHLTKLPLADNAAVERAARQLLENGTQLVVVSMGEQGALFVDSTTALLAVPPTVQVKSTVGAGDAMVAGLVAGQIQDLSLSECARLATAFSLGKITHIGSQLPTSDVLQAYGEQVSISLKTS